MLRVPPPSPSFTSCHMNGSDRAAMHPQSLTYISMELNATIVSTGFVLIASALWLRWKYGGKPKSMNIPGDNGKWPIIGDTMRLLNPRLMASYQISCIKRWGPVWRTSVLFKKCVFVSGNEHIKRLASEEMSKRNTQACFPPHHKALFGEHSILVTSGEEHHKVRRVISPLLQPNLYKKEIELSAAAFVEDCLRCTECIQLVPKFKQFTLRVTLRIVVGDARWEEWMHTNTSKLLSLLDDFAIWSKGLLSAPTASIPFTPAYRAMQARVRIKKVLTEIIEDERNTLESDDVSAAASNMRSSLIKKLLLESRKEQSHITDDVIIDNILTFLFAGTDTTASILTSSFYELSKNHSLLNRLRSYIDNEAQDSEHTVDEVLLAFVSEVQRLYPAAPFTMREIVNEGVSMGDEYGIIPPGYLVTYSIAGTLLNDEESYPNSQVFDLDRWLSKINSKSSSKPPVCAFGGGNRICPGRFLANAECLALLRLVLGKRHGFEWELVKGQNVDYTYTPGYFPNDGLLITVIRRRDA